MATERNFGVELQLGKHQAYADHYDANLLQPIAREICRQHLPWQNFLGWDIWTAYELSWLDLSGKPQVAVAEFSFPATSRYIIESKSFKYYLNSLNQTRIADRQTLRDLLVCDLSHAADASVEIQFVSTPSIAINCGSALLVDDLALSSEHYQPNADLLRCSNFQQNTEQVLCSHLLKSNCPVTGQPDWASLWVGYSGPQILPESFLAYVVSYRQHQDFHENCVEQIFVDLWQRCQPQSLWVYARYTRRGGLDINPFRSSEAGRPPELRGFRQ